MRARHLRRLALYGAVIVIAAGGMLSAPSPAAAAAPKGGGGEEVLFSLPIGPDGITYEGLATEQRPWGPAAIVADESGTLWIADTAADRVLGYSRSGKRLTTIDLSGRAVGVTDIVPMGSRLALLDSAAYPPAVLTVAKSDGLTISIQELPSSMGLDAGLRGISIGSDQQLYADVGSSSLPLDGMTLGGPGHRGAYGVARVEVGRTSEHRSATISYRGKQIPISVEHRLAGVALVGDTAEQSVYAVDEAVDDGGVLRVDRTVRAFAADGKALGLARVAIASSLYVEHGLTLTPKNEIVALLARKASVDVVLLRPTATVASILPAETIPPARTAATFQDSTMTTLSCRSYDSMRSVAYDYRTNSRSLSNTNINGTCSGRTKPRYLTTAKTYPSVSYDWDGWTTVDAWNDYMAAGKQAGNITKTATAGDCAKGVDCSGFVSRVWGLSSHVYTNGLDNYSTTVAFHSMLPFDIFLDQGSHVVFFSGWYDDTETDFYIYEATAYNKYDRVVYRLVDASYISGYQKRSFDNRC